MAATESDPERALLLSLALFTLEAEEVEEGTDGGVLLWWVDVDWDGRLCDVDDDDDDGFFFFLTDVGASYVRKDSKDMVGVSKSSSSSLDEESFDICDLPGEKQVMELKRWWPHVKKVYCYWVK